MGNKTKDRKIDHIKIVLSEDVEYRKNKTLFENIILIHNSLPELSMDEIDLKVTFLNRTFNYPILIDSMTGGIRIAKKINENLAKAASMFNIPISCGSQRAALEDPTLIDTYRIMRDIDTNLFIIGNIGVQQLLKDPITIVDKIIKMIDANALAIHLNPLQEVVQHGGDVNFKGCLKAIEKVVNEFEIPIIVKETGAGISREVAIKLEKVGVSAINIAGAGGTSWSAVEILRNKYIIKNDVMVKITKPFREWGIPTAVSLLEVLSVVNIPVIASGGIRTGIEAAKALVIGASLVGIARPFLKVALKSENAVLNLVKMYVEQLKMTMLLIGAKNINALQNVKYIIIGKLKEWLEERGVIWKKTF